MGQTLITALPAYAVSGATAGTYAGSTNDFTHQVTRWLGTLPKFIARDLTVVYLGYNDINRSLGAWGKELDDVKADYLHPAAADHRRWRGRQIAPHLPGDAARLGP